MKKISLYIFMLLVSVTAWYSCETEDHFYDGPERFSFIEGTSDFMLVLPTSENTFSIQIGVTTASETDRNINFKVSGESTAVDGEHFVTPIAKAVIPAGQYIGTLEIKANFDGFTDNEAKELIVQFADEHNTLDNNEYTISMQRMCPLEISNLVGNYSVVGKRFHRNGNTDRDFTYDATIEAVSGKDDQLKVTNVGGYGGEIIVNLDITAVNLIPVSFEMQVSGYDAELFNETGLAFGDVTYRDMGGSLIYVCDEKLELNFGTIGSPGFYSLGTAIFIKK